MRRLIVCLTIAGAATLPGTGVAEGKDHGGTMCVLHARLRAQDETTGSTSTARGHTLIKVRKNGTIAFKTKINNPNHETFVAGHIHKAPPGTAGARAVAPVVPPAAPAPRRHL